MSKVWFITGAGKGIGKAIADAALRNGDCVVATTRKANDYLAPDGCADRVLSIQLDVSNPNQSIFDSAAKYSLQGTTQGRYLTGGVPPVRFSM